MHKVFFALLLTFVALAVSAQDVALADILIEGENWTMVSEGHQFVDGPCPDAEGKLYFADVAKGEGIQCLVRDGAWWKRGVGVTDDNPSGLKISGLKLGPDGLFYACLQHPKKQIISISNDSRWQINVLLDDAAPNDLVVHSRGFIYYTKTDAGQVILIDHAARAQLVGASSTSGLTEKATHRVAATGLNKPNGIALSPDQGSLYVSEFGGTNVWAFRIEKDGSLAHGAPYMTLRTVPGKTAALGDGMTTDALGRTYVSSELGIQVFDPIGRMAGIIAKPQPKFLASVAFAGPNREYLYAFNQDKIFRRKTKVKGAPLPKI